MKIWTKLPKKLKLIQNQPSIHILEALDELSSGKILTMHDFTSYTIKTPNTPNPKIAPKSTFYIYSESS